MTKAEGWKKAYQEEAAHVARQDARIRLLETHLRRVLEAGAFQRQKLLVLGSELHTIWDRAASDAEGVLHG